MEYYLAGDGKLDVKEGSLYFENLEGAGRSLPSIGSDNIILTGDVSISKSALLLTSRHRMTIIVAHANGGERATVSGFHQRPNATLTLAQAERYRHDPARLALARAFLAGAFQNIERNLRYFFRRGNAVEVFDLKEALARLEACESTEEMMGMEGSLRKNYYQQWTHLLDPEWEFTGRSHRPPLNSANALLSFLNVLTYSLCTQAAHAVGLCVSIGFLHASDGRRESLALDLAEVFKPLLAERVFLTLLRKRMIQPKDFDQNALLLKKTGKQIVLRAWNEKLDTTFHHPRLDRLITYRSAVRLECYKLVKDLLGIEPYQPLVIRW